MSNWFVYNKKENYMLLKDIKSLTNIQKLILANRDITSETAVSMTIDSSYTQMYDPFLMKDMSKAIDLIFEHMMQGSNIRIVGDYDSDGVSSTTILMKGIGLFYDKISYVIPDRVEDGYGLNKSIVDKAIDDNVSLLITCDNGIAAFDAIDYANTKLLDVIITDHHQVVKESGQEIIPNAKAVVNPSQNSCAYPFKSICGAVVAYKLVDAMYQRYGKEFSVSCERVLELLQFAALGTVTDVMPLIDENRIIVVEGLKRLNNTKNLGMIELLNQLNWNKELSVYTLGFIIGPTINATGRLFTAKLAVELFLDDDLASLKEYARELIALNSERKKMTQDAVESAIDKIKQENLFVNDIILLYMEDVHESICGLVAGRVKEHFNKPALVFTNANKDGYDFLKGSGRSIERYDMHKEMSQINNLFEAFGGHKMACGLTIKKENFELINKSLNENSNLKEEDFVKTINIDAGLDFRVVNFDFISQVNALEPFGNGFSKPRFASKNVTIRNIAVLGKDKNLLKMKLYQNGIELEAINFNPDTIIKYLSEKYKVDASNYRFEKLINKDIDLVYTLGINNFNGRTNIQLIIEEIR